ncbi:hypothetical protein N136_02498 [Leifsonia aquatica ATCC 14665]|uniref:Uncharacterized protein n=1 Tax=Leifsonia aquatica ATCC 14665 TaxID=1358026 RepID=U2T8X1_LEIAQ|nr:hypothetical protein N136_02498 [Leifsonia aquatica ATCC 14665]
MDSPLHPAQATRCESPCASLAASRHGEDNSTDDDADPKGDRR